MKIQKKLILSFGLLILILVGEMVVNQIITYRAKKTFLELKEETGPTIKLLDDYKSVNRELSLLNNTWIANYNKGVANKINGIIDVELPYFKSQVILLKDDLPVNDPRISLIENIINHTEDIIAINKKLNNLLVTSEDYASKSKMNDAWYLVNERSTPLHFVLNDAVYKLQTLYNRQFETSQDALLENLEAVSNIILILGVFGIIIGLIIGRQVISTILQSISNLSDLAKKVSSGKFGMQAKLKGNDELTVLGKSLNSMSLSLEEIFNTNEKKINELQEFSYIATHDLKVPIDNIIGFHNALKKDLDLDNPRTKTIFEWLENSTDQAHKIIADLIKVTQDEYEEFEVEDIDIHEVFIQVQDYLGRNISLSDAEIITDFNCETVKYSRRQLVSIFQNLLGNAIKYHSPKRKLEIKVSSKIEGEFVCIAFTDNGLGINLDTQRERLFGLFKRIYTEVEGSGMGLYMIKKSIEKAGGKIDVESEIDIGSTFFVYLKV